MDSNNNIVLKQYIPDTSFTHPRVYTYYYYCYYYLLQIGLYPVAMVLQHTKNTQNNTHTHTHTLKTINNTQN
jgi:hypothetical protein